MVTELEAVQTDPIAWSLAQALVLANREAAKEDMLPPNSTLEITEKDTETGRVWAIWYLPLPRFRQRGGDVGVLVDQRTGEVREVILGM